MRSSRRYRNVKKNSRRCKVKNKKYSSKSTAMWDRNFNISMTSLENINEVIRVNKLRNAEGKGSWKFVPRDSCEVYKDRRKRIAKNKPKREEVRNPERKKKKMPKKTKESPRKSQQRTRKDSSPSSVTSTYYSSTTSRAS